MAVGALGIADEVSAAGVAQAPVLWAAQRLPIGIEEMADTFARCWKGWSAADAGK